MKKQTLFFILLTALAFQTVKAQGTYVKEGSISKVEYRLEHFTGISAGGIDDIIINTQPQKYSVIVETEDNLQDNVRIKVKKGVLKFSYSGISPKKLRFYVTAPYIDYIKASGASDIKVEDTLKAPSLTIDCSGASDIKLKAKVEELKTDAEGAADLRITGKAQRFYINASGAADVKAGGLIADSVFAKADGAATIIVNPVNYLNKHVSGAADIKLAKESKKVVQITTGNGSSGRVIVYGENLDQDYSDTTNIKIGSFEVEVIDGDTTKVKVGNHVLIVDNDGDVKLKSCKPRRFNGHWGGVELGINGYLTPDFDANFGKEYDYLSLRYEKSIAVNLNLWEQDFSLNRAKTLGFITGLGLSFNNYRFTQPTYLSPDSLNLSGFYMRGVSVRKSKLTAMYLSLPLIFEIQTNNPHQRKRVHFGLGAIVNARLRSHTKIYFNEANKQYRLEDPVTGIPSFNYYTTPNNGNRNIVKSFDSFSLQPFRIDATARIGFGPLNIFATYGLTQMFQKERGPELYNWVIGITLAGW